jgi:Spherulation-specific family 4
MAFDFPANPTIGQQFSPVSGVVYFFNGTTWDRSGSGGGLPVGSTLSSSALTDSRTGVLIPGYIYPGNPYSDTVFMGLLDTIRKYHMVPVIYVLNPGDGPGTAWDGNYAAAIRLLRAAGAIIAGYVSTAYAARNPDLVKADVSTWVSMYADTPVDGIFYDEMPWDTGTSNVNVTLYQEYYAWVYAQNLNMVIGNPGTNQQGIWYAATPRTADIIVTWETGVYPTESDLHGNYIDGHVDYSYKTNSILVHSQAFDAAKFAMMRKYAKWIWITDDLLSPNPWDALPTYMAKIFDACVTLPPTPS